MQYEQQISKITIFEDELTIAWSWEKHNQGDLTSTTCSSFRRDSDGFVIVFIIFVRYKERKNTSKHTNYTLNSMIDWRIYVVIQFYNSDKGLYIAIHKFL